MEPFPSSAFKICTDGRSPGLAPGFFGGPSRDLLIFGAWRSPRWPGVGRALQRHPFSGLVDSAEKITLPGAPAGVSGLPNVAVRRRVPSREF
ncbi:hypothetical protein C4D60_Mb10t25540 [Musa balbisiana]|uniref:Uncharacterized protein n=1 Tax=Musa balbisiana TaxID=52838 RepID=A0A4S8IZU0_MUSBA|nr:hypothetical protein C4D60_Mb10t25540 [Musa balbisiana]